MRVDQGNLLPDGLLDDEDAHTFETGYLLPDGLLDDEDAHTFEWDLGPSSFHSMCLHT